MHDATRRRRFLQGAAGAIALAGMSRLVTESQAAMAANPSQNDRRDAAFLAADDQGGTRAMLFDGDSWQALMSGYSVYDCTIMDATRTFYVMVERTGDQHRDPLPRTRFLFVRAGLPLDQGRFVLSEVGSFGFTEVAFGPALTEFVAVDSRQQVFSYDRNRAGLEADIPGALTPALMSTTRKIVRVGRRLFAIGWPRRVFARVGLGSWDLLDTGMPLPSQICSSDEGDQVAAQIGYTLNDLAGFAENDMYAVGDAGEVWRFDGTRWTRCAFRSEEKLCTVACSADGKAYVTTEAGRVWSGRGNDWQILAVAGRSAPIRDSAWFADRLWCGSDDGLHVLEKGRFSLAGIPADISRAACRIDLSADGRYLLAAGAHGAALFDGSRWDLLFSAFEHG